MKKILILISMLLLASLTACGGNTEKTAENTPEPTAVVAQATDTAVAEAPAPAATETVADATAPLEPGCYPDSIDSLITMLPNDFIPVPSDNEWQTGGAKASISVVEYSDFQ